MGARDLVPNITTGKEIWLVKEPEGQEPKGCSSQSNRARTVTAPGGSATTKTATHSTTMNPMLFSSAEDATCLETAGLPHSANSESQISLKPWPPAGVKWYYSDDSCCIALGDCREILPTLPKADLVLTDPPYGNSTETNNSQKSRGFRHYDRKQSARDLPPVYDDNKPFNPSHLMRMAENFVLWGANNYASKLPDSACWFGWDRKTERGAKSDITDLELAWTRGLHFKTVRIFRHMWAGFQRDSEVGELVLHPTQKPVALMTWCLSFFPDAKTICDPYCGSGPVLRAAKDLGRKAIGIEIDEQYCEIAAKRLAQEVLAL